MNWSYINDSKSTPRGFAFAGIKAGLKDSKKKDLGLILAPDNSICSGVFTQSIVRAPCVEISERRIQITGGLIKAILINSGQANACTGSKGIEDALHSSKILSQVLGVNENQVLICSTGVIGVPLPMDSLVNNIPNLVDELEDNNFSNITEAILTTDLVTKKIVIQTCIEGRYVRIAGFAKGSGMIYPNMATMLAFLTCDVGIDKEMWDKIISEATLSSFNAISVDGETSTNDSFIAINSGPKVSKKYLPIIKEGIHLVCEYLAKSIVRDGEGANCLFEVLVKGVKNNFDAISIARAICNSQLVKTAIHGCDPNWGRIISAAGNSGVEFDLKNLDLLIGPFEILKKGNLQIYKSEIVSQYMRSKMFRKHCVDDPLKITIKLSSGDGIGKSWGCDLSKRYVEINSEYTT